ncbi:heat shock protein transcriptional repressor HspR [Corynebacterium sp.]|uniref:heat shock protein transcriptional repressor HspR n=1 Tax=Corynebacterium sp. TaxID=1720 RepID=UPI003736284E
MTSPKKKDKVSDDLSEVFVISVAAELSGMHAQTLRTYDRMGLVTPMRTSGGGRRYTRGDVATLREIQRLSQKDGVNLAGIKAIIRLNDENEKLREQLDAARAENRRMREQLTRGAVPPGREIVHVPQSTAVVMWRPRRRRTTSG